MTNNGHIANSKECDKRNCTKGMCRILLLSVVVIMFLPTKLDAQSYYTTEGTDFWLAVSPNWRDDDIDQYYFAASSKHACTVTLTNPITGWSHTMSVNANSTTIYAMPTTLSNQVWQAGSCATLNKGLHITATDTIQFHFFNHSGYANSSDAGTILPTSCLGLEYVIMTYPTGNSAAYSTAFFSVLATEDNTDVSITFNGNTRNNTYPSGRTISITLNAGQVYQVMATDNTGDLTGSRISVQNCKPVAVFCGSTHTDVPMSGNGADHLFQQALPTTLWANEWILVPSREANHDYVRIISASDSCQIFLNGNRSTTIDAYDVYEFDINSPKHITTSKPVMLFQYLPSRYNGMGDPASFAPNPIHMTTRCALFPVFPVASRYPATSLYYATIIVPTSQTSLLRYNNSPIPQTFYPIAYTSYSYANIPISNSGQNKLTTSGDGFFGHTYGLGEDWDSYAFNLGGTDTTLYNLFPHIYDDTIDTTVCGNRFSLYGHTYIHSGEYTLPAGCTDITLRLTLLPNFEFYTDTNICGSHCSWRGEDFSLPGQYSVSKPAPNGCDSIFHLDLALHPIYNQTIPVTNCSETYVWNDSVINQSGEYTHTYASVDGCDSIVTIDLSLYPSYDIVIDTSVCYDSIFWNGQSYPVPGSQTIQYSTIHGCDSIYHLNITNDNFDTTYYVQIADTQSYTWINGITYNNDIDTAIYIIYPNGCDTTYRLKLIVDRIPGNERIWIPNVLTPSRSDNNVFKIYSKNIDKMEVSIYHRWGNWVCTFDGLTQYWDGTKNGIPCIEGAYVYHIRYHVANSNETPHPIIGTVTLIR